MVRLSKSVSLNMDVRGMEQSATIAINDRCQSLQREGRNVYRLGLGQSPFPVPKPVVDALKLHAHEKAYLPARGLPELRRAVAEFHRRHDGVEALSENVMVGPGSKELMFLLQIVYYGQLLVPTPCWVSYIPQAKIVGRKIGLIPTTFETCWQVTAEQLRQRFERQNDPYRPRILILNYPANPHGCTYSAEELEELAAVCCKYEMVILSDEIYGQTNFLGDHVSMARFCPEHTIISSGLSKWCGAGGWRLGTFTFPSSLDWLRDAMTAAASETYTSVSAPIQYAAVRAFLGGTEIERYLWHSRRILADIAIKLTAMLAEAGASVHPPDGAFYLFPDFSPLADRLAMRGITSSTTLCEQLLQDTGVAMLPGSDFGRPPEELTARIAYVDFDGAKALTASETIPLDQSLPDSFAETWCLNVLKGVRVLVDWLGK
ncbi:MAG: aminotransferase class I/II-fold pyridoxal phosphate-dependent enzyme [bacterium]|nr:aminotransferase class I/II-fold pyridoxal phosphate-dependent enzyme [bacterium]